MRVHVAVVVGSYRQKTRSRGSDDQQRRRFRRRAARTTRACAGPSDASEALSRAEGEMTAFQIRSALIRAD